MTALWAEVWMLLYLAAGSVTGTRPATFPETAPRMNEIAARAPQVPAEPLRLALQASACAAQTGIAQGTDKLVLVDYSKPSTEKRLWVLDLRTGRVLFEELVAHGKNSGAGAIPVRFSNRQDSLMSSLGLFVTGESYIGKEGYGMKLYGLEPGFNDNSERRAIVMHGAWYVNESIARRFGRLGLSWGCPSVRKAVVRPLVDTIKDGAFFFAYYPDEHWLRHSALLRGCPAPTASRSTGR